MLKPPNPPPVTRRQKIKQVRNLLADLKYWQGWHDLATSILEDAPDPEYPDLPRKAGLCRDEAADGIAYAKARLAELETLFI